MIDAQPYFKILADRGTKILHRWRTAATSPIGRKTLPAFGIGKVAELSGYSTPKIRDLIASGEISQPDVDPKTGRKLFTLKIINELRRHKGTNPTRKAKRAIRVAFANLKGGVAKTTESVHFAQYAALRGFRVLFIDMDPQGTSSTYFGYIPDIDLDVDDTIYPALVEDPAKINSLPRETYWDQLYIIPSQLNMQGAEWAIPASAAELGANQNRLRQALDFFDPAIASVDFDIVVIDCPPSFGMLSSNSILAADYLITPVFPEANATASMFNYFRILEEVAEAGDASPNHAMRLLKHDILVGKFKRTNQDLQKDEATKQLSMLKEAFQADLLDAIIPETEQLRKSSNRMKTIYEMEPSEVTRETHLRAVDAFNAVNQAILDNMQALWSQIDHNNPLVSKDANLPQYAPSHTTATLE